MLGTVTNSAPFFRKFLLINSQALKKKMDNFSVNLKTQLLYYTIHNYSILYISRYSDYILVQVHFTNSKPHQS